MLLPQALDQARISTHPSLRDLKRALIVICTGRREVTNLSETIQDLIHPLLPCAQTAT
jgi:hypothetical protein